MKVRILRYRRPIVVAVHLVAVVASNYLAFLLRFDGRMPPEHVEPFLKALPILMLCRGLLFVPFRVYQGLWRYVSVWDLQKISAAVAVSSVVFGVLVRGVLNIEPYPRSVFLLDAILLVMLLGAARLVRRGYRKFDRFQSEKRVLVYGAGDAGEMIVRDMKSNRFYNADPIGFIDDDPAKVRRSIHGVKVLGTRADLPRIMAVHQPHEVLVAMASAEPSQLRGIVKSLEPFKVPIKTLPNLRDVLDGKVAIGDVRNLSLEDLMPREPIGLDPEPVRRLVNARTVLVTGAGGSIGSELSRQLAGFGPSRLLLLERYENSLFDLCNELGTMHATAFEPIIADITDAARINDLMRHFRPDVVFHAAAHKHVPLMEVNPTEAVKNNVRGTRVLAESAARHGVAKFVLISTDKAVNPSSVMGATKRVAELIVRSMNRPSGTCFVAVRFGNVLGSNGSVTKVFATQIRRGGPVTVTHPEIRRYFMLIPEAVHLVLHAAARPTGGGIYALEMGDQIRIQDLARNMIRLSGFVPDEEIALDYVGLRPGEKLYEELFEDPAETVEVTDVSKVLIVKGQPISLEGTRTRIAHLEAAADEGRSADVLYLLQEIIPTFRPPVEGASRAAVPVIRMSRAAEGAADSVV
jgi:FlaA1/EpsC-like NDP-sugar epimerase